ncbi:unnamed protein product (macronuclear) [Paramecium tetraurelia]|uniref:Peptidase A1 domain-containing protein n=1 Tax=Paramecium tetraurelia TaxID=5888 RepID=A0DE21_PARTE|nr:uncharacterized protein GSPATT00016130001 [Paramecium tetraurelia]CAK81288.1 unnamed protein product [Paramecium tetraurelia]|eukprot:XP_001448685.1 hypothetical protein (macronuclear) [Paramecium tetraurelia strain d4-2]
MLLFLSFYIVSSMYPISYKDGQPHLSLDSDLKVQLKLDEDLSEFLHRHSQNDRCPEYEYNECYAEVYQNGERKKVKLEKEIFYIYDIQSDEDNSQTIIYSDQSLQETKIQESFLALAPFQNHQNTFYSNGFSLCLSETEGYIITDFNSISQNTEQLNSEGVFNKLKEEKYVTYSLHLQYMEIAFKVYDTTSYSIYIVSDDLISIPKEIFPQKYFYSRGFVFDSTGFYYRDHRDHSDDDLEPLLFYNNANQDNPLIVDPANYVFHDEESGQDILKIYSEEQYGNAIILGLPFLKNKKFNVQTQENYVYIEQLRNGLCIQDESQSIGVWEIIFIVLQLILLPFLVYFTFKKLRQHEQQKQQQRQTQQFITELQ